MQSSSRAPLLSAPRTRVSCWITSDPGSLGLLDDLRQTPALRLRERARLDDQDEVADVRPVALVVRVELRGAPDDLLVPRVGLHRVDADDDRLVHRGRDDHAAALLAATALTLRLRLPDDRFALRRGSAFGLRALATQAPRKPLLLPLRLGLNGRGRRHG